MSSFIVRNLVLNGLLFSLTGLGISPLLFDRKPDTIENMLLLSLLKLILRTRFGPKSGSLLLRPPSL